MPILDVIETPIAAVIQRCAPCGNVATVPRSGLVLGHADPSDAGEASADLDMIVMPTCSKCGAVEFLNRTFDQIPDERAAHRKKVNALAISLKDSGQVHPRAAKAIAAETRRPQQVGELLGKVVETRRPQAAAVRQALGMLSLLQNSPRVKPTVDKASGDKPSSDEAPTAAVRRPLVKPAKAEPAKAEPAKAEPAKAEPAKAEPAKAEPAKAEPAKAEPAKAEPAKAEPAKAEAPKGKK